MQAQHDLMGYLPIDKPWLEYYNDAINTALPTYDF